MSSNAKRRRVSRTKIKKEENVLSTKNEEGAELKAIKAEELLTVKQEIRADEEQEGNSMQLTYKNVIQKFSRFASRKMVGVHVSAAGGAHNAIYNALSLGCTSFSLFIRNQRRWDSKPMDDSAVEKWNNAIEATSYPLSLIIPHGSYLINAGSPEEEKLTKSREAMLDECQRCERLGITLYNFHPGSTVKKCTREECIKRIAETVNFIHENTALITLVLETTAGTGNTIGGTFEDLRDIITKVNDKKRIGVCIDTCHIFAAGYDLRTPAAYEETMNSFQDVVGFTYLKALHMNDSKGVLGSCVDRHANIGHGELGVQSFQNIMRDPRLNDIPLILETPEGMYAKEIDILYRLQSEKLTDCKIKYGKIKSELSIKSEIKESL
ncbi:xylose isomerase-like TIM barrel domain-containing protein [Ditylenchus destructor]|nr:xylose isomerase-like TIM barrel domain-containing protein [Ditylenchus destructor]